MSKKNVIVSNVSEGHDNPIAELVQVACQFDSDIMLESDNRRINAKSIMGIMAFNPSDGMSVDIVTEGADEEAALDAIEKFLVCEEFWLGGIVMQEKKFNKAVSDVKLMKTPEGKTEVKNAVKDATKKVE